jgi:hypothetical protein
VLFCAIAPLHWTISPSYGVVQCSSVHLGFRGLLAGAEQNSLQFISMISSPNKGPQADGPVPIQSQHWLCALSPRSASFVLSLNKKRPRAMHRSFEQDSHLAARERVYLPRSAALASAPSQGTGGPGTVVRGLVDRQVPPRSPSAQNTCTLEQRLVSMFPCAGSRTGCPFPTTACWIGGQKPWRQARRLDGGRP